MTASATSTMIGVLLLVGCDLRDPVAGGTESTATTGGPQWGTEEGGPSGPQGLDTSGGPALTSTSSGSDSGSESGSDSTGTTAVCLPDPVDLEPAALAVDVLLAVDASGSMNLEMETIGDQFPAFFSGLHGLGSARAALIAPYPDVDPAGVCIGPPMGQDGCPSDDDNPPAYVHLDVALTSFGTLSGIVDTQPLWSADFRDGAPLHVIVVSDDNPATTAEEFSAQLDGFTFHALSAEMDPFGGCLEAHPCCNLSSEVGVEYETLVEETGGVLHSLCDLDATSFFEDVLERVEADAAPPCHYALPAPPADPALLAVFVDASPLSRADGPDACGDDGGWYFADDAIVVLCPATCDAGGDVTAELGCPG